MCTMLSVDWRLARYVLCSAELDGKAPRRPVVQKTHRQNCLQ